MKKVLVLLVLCMFMAMPAKSFADDFAAIPCSDYNGTPAENDKLMFILWLDGFLGGASDVTVTSPEWFAAFYNHINTYCAANPSVTILEASLEMEDMDIEGEDALDNPCSEIIAEAGNPQEVAALLMWSDGYLSAKSEKTVLDEAFLGSLGEHIISYCDANADKTLRDALAGQAK